MSKGQLPLGGPTEKTAHELLCESSEWFSPPDIIEAARAVLGEIDLDPASCRAANETVRATNYYHKEDNGLSYWWHGRVYLNPPSPPGPWWKYLVKEMHELGVKSVIYLAYNIEQLQQIQHWTPGVLEDACICIPKKRVRFNQPSDQLGMDGALALVPGPSPTHASAIIGLGVDAERFHDHFSPLGMCR